MFSWRSSDKIIRKAFQKATSGGVDDAITLLRRAARSSDPKGDRAEALGMICYQHSRWDAAAAAFASSRIAQPANMLRLYYYCSAAGHHGAWEEALAALDRAASDHPDDVAPNSARCLLLLERGDRASATMAYEQARRVFIRKPHQSAYSMGLLQQALDSLAEAVPPTT